MSSNDQQPNWTENEHLFVKRCLEYQEQICILLGANSEGRNIFDTHSGKVVLNFDENGILQEVETDKVLYRRRRR